ncbi:MAG: hypothetical protein EB127_24925 [Alphaproteobacteria bacterium]|nr:hypothetical protein [Alphaproteobacteria bacterium]
MRTCLSSFSDFFKDLACVPHDTVKNVEETKPPSLDEVKEPTNTLVENAENTENTEVDNLDSVYDDTMLNSNDKRSSYLEIGIILVPLVLGAFYSYMMVHLIQPPKN